MVAVEVRVSGRVDELAGAEAAGLGDHQRQQGVGGDVERHAEEHVRAALIQLAGEFPVRHIELEEAVAGRQGHLVNLAGIPGGHQQAAAVGMAADHVDDIRELVDAPAVRRGPGAPLMAVDRPQVPVLVRPLVPDGHAVVLEILDVGIPGDEPEELVDDRFEVDLLGGQQREAGAEVEAHLVAEHALRAHTGAVRLHRAVRADMSEQIQVLFHNRHARPDRASLTGCGGGC